MPRRAGGRTVHVCAADRGNSTDGQPMVGDDLDLRPVVIHGAALERRIRTTVSRIQFTPIG
jgi:hypothetical protein